MKMTRAIFIANIMSDLLAIGRQLFTDTGGDVAEAKVRLRRIPDHWKDVNKRRAELDAELADLKAQGK